MSPANDNTRFFWSMGSFWGWTIAFAGSILLNVTLFGLMPGLIQQIPDSPDTLEELQHIQVIRVKRVETPPRKKQQKRKIKAQPVKKIQQKRMTQIRQRKVTLKPRLDFELNPKLPAAPMDLVMPALENFSMDGPIFKDVGHRINGPRKDTSPLSHTGQKKGDQWLCRCRISGYQKGPCGTDRNHTIRT